MSEKNTDKKHKDHSKDHFKDYSRNRSNSCSTFGAFSPRSVLEFTDSFSSDAGNSLSPEESDLETIVFIHGYPDDASMWRAQVEALHDSYRCICLNLPGYGEKKLAFGRTFDFDEVIELIDVTLMQLRIPIRGKFHLVTHDWGAVYGYLFAARFSEKIQTVSAIDVGAQVGKQKNPVGYVIMPLYQILLACGYASTGIPVIGDSISKVLTQGVFTGLRLASGESALAGPSRKTPFSQVQNYPYYYFWKNILLRSQKIKISTPKVPFFFAFGSAGMKKLMNFHSQEWLDQLNSRADCMVQEFKESGHWLMKDSPNEYNHSLRLFLKKNSASRERP